MNYIYALVHPKTLSVRYIGKTNNLKCRLSFHIRDVSKTHKANWIKALKRKGLLPGLIVLEETGENWQEREMYYIKHYRNLGAKLCNGTDGGDGYKGGTNSATKAVKSYDLKGNFLARYSSVTDASKLLVCNRAHISECCKKKIHTACGKIWRYDEEELGTIINNRKIRAIAQFDLANNYITSYSSIEEAAKFFKCKAPNISRVLRGERKKFRKFIFRYKDIV